jgi:hypothetical protein
VTGLSEPARLAVEVVEVGVVVDVEPVTACTGGLFGGAADQACADTSPLTGEVDERIQDEGVNASVPAELDEADELISFPRAMMSSANH